MELSRWFTGFSTMVQCSESNNSSQYRVFHFCLSILLHSRSGWKSSWSVSMESTTTHHLVLEFSASSDRCLFSKFTLQGSDFFSLLNFTLFFFLRHPLTEVIWSFKLLWVQGTSYHMGALWRKNDDPETRQYVLHQLEKIFNFNFVSV